MRVGGGQAGGILEKILREADVGQVASDRRRRDVGVGGVQLHDGRGDVGVDGDGSGVGETDGVGAAAGVDRGRSVGGVEASKEGC